ncbi:MAG: sigma-70 family RNA polymerase sigma factor [Parvibaculaceae bacterium]
MSGDEPLENLLARVALRDRQAFAELYRRTCAKLFGICLRILNERTDAEEVLQETYVKVWRNADRFVRERASPITWMAAIARNQAIDRMRARKPASDPIETVLDLGDGRPSPEAEALAADDGRALRNCLDELQDKQRAAIREVYFTGFTYDELARRTGTPLGTVKSWIRRGLARLKDCLER